MLRVVSVVIAALSMLGAAYNASAHDIVDNYYYDTPYGPDVMIIERRMEIYRDAPIVVDRYAPSDYVRAYERPRSCGVYRYWDGIGCVDVRYVPPYLGPKW